jgi:hypothetical protein
MEPLIGVCCQSEAYACHTVSALNAHNIWHGDKTMAVKKKES